VKIHYIQKVTKRQTKYGPRSYGPYWYAFWRDGKKVRCKYVGEKLTDQQRKAVKDGFATIRYLRADLAGQETFAWDPDELKAKHGYKPLTIPQGITREKARKLYFWAKQRKTVTDYGRQLFDRDFGELCIARGWRSPLKSRTTSGQPGAVGRQFEAAGEPAGVTVV
jgi:hypothetical protein